jgi:iron(III) transport system ATP-binding protein
VSVNGLAQSFGGRPILRGVELQVPAGHLSAVLRASGCGKTTWLRVLAGFERPDAGTLSIGDVEVGGPDPWLPPERRGIGYVAQEGALLPHLGVAENIALGLTGAPNVPVRGEAVAYPTAQ